MFRKKSRVFMGMLVAMFMPRMAAAADLTSDDIRSLGVGMWCYELKNKYGSAKEMAEKAQSVGLGSIRIKVHDGTKIFRDAPKANDLAMEMHKRGVKVLTWGFNYARKPEIEADLIIKKLEEPWCDGYVFNPEKPLESLDTWDNVEILVSRVRVHRDTCPICHHKLLGFAPFAIPSLHSKLNYRAFVENTDFLEPQVYWGDMELSPQEAMVWTMREWQKWQKENGLQKPIVPLGQAFDPHVDRVNNTLGDGEIRQFGKITHGYYAVSFWDWQQVTPKWWNEITEVCAYRKADVSPVVGTTMSAAEPELNALATETPWWKRCWNSMWDNYPAGLALVITVGMVTMVFYGVDQSLRWRMATVTLVLALMWPVVVAAALATGSVAVSVFLARILAKKIGEYKAK
jgi:hypothetical protein